MSLYPAPQLGSALKWRRLTHWPIVILCVFAAVLLSSESPVCGETPLAQENVLFYPCYGVRSEAGWEVELRVWVYEERALAEVIASGLASSFGEITDDRRAIFRKRSRHFLADSESRERVEFSFEDDPQGEVWTLADAKGKALESDANGNIVGVLRISEARANELLMAQKAENGWLTIKATSPNHLGRGRIRLIEPTGVSIISDIDDTVKITEILAGAQVVSRNIFLMDYRPATELRSVFEMNPEAPVHYVSAGPWQLYEPLSLELIQADDILPEGTFHMRSLRTNLLTLSSWKDLGSVLLDKEGTQEYKVGVISRLMKDFPDRKFILLGDSGEVDPEVYRKIQTEFPEQVKEIVIRDVVNARELQVERLKDMTVVPAPTVLPGVSQFASE
jgi:hypothetical protein